MSFWEPRGYDAMRRRFADQFEETEAGPVFRPDGKGAGVRVTPVEREHFIADYDRYLSKQRWRSLAWSMIPLLSVIAVYVAAAVTQPDLPQWPLYVAIPLMMMPALVQAIRSNREAMRAPVAAVYGRPVAAPALSREVARRTALTRIPWRGLAAGLLYSAYLVYRYRLYELPWDAEKFLFGALAAGLSGLILVQAVRKLRIERLS